MFNIIKRHRKLRDIFNIKESETKLSLFFSTVLCLFFYYINLYDKLNLYSAVLHDIVMCFLGGFIGIIGFALSGMALMIGLFSRKQIDIIENCNGKGIIEEIMSSYAFLAFISAINIFILIIISFAISFEGDKFPVFLFCVCVFSIVYLLLFNIFYAVSLVFNCVSLFTISKIYSTCEEQSNIVPIANEIMIDFILGILVKKYSISRMDVLEGLKKEASDLPEETQKKLMEHFEKHYSE